MITKAKRTTMNQNKELYYHWLEIKRNSIKLFSRKFKNKGELDIFWEKGYPEIFEDFYSLAGRPKMSFCEITEDRLGNPLNIIIQFPEHQFDDCFAVINGSVPVSWGLLVLDCSDFSDLWKPLQCIDFFDAKLIEQKNLLIKASQR